MTGILIRRGRFGDTLAHTQGRWSSDDVARNWSDVAKTQGMVRHGRRHQIWILDSRPRWAFGTLISPGSLPAAFSGPFHLASLLALLLLTSNGWSPQGSVRAPPSESLARWPCHSLVFKSHRCVDYTKLDIPVSGAFFEFPSGTYKSRSDGVPVQQCPGCHATPPTFILHLTSFSSQWAYI